MIRIQKAGRHGIVLPELSVGFDYNSADVDYIFVSHAHADHMPRNRNLHVYATGPTARLMKLRGYKGDISVLDFGEKLKIPGGTVRFYPAGHILGSAMTYVESGQGTVLYTGDYRRPPSPASEGFEMPQPVDYLITEATFSLPIYKWPSHEVLTEEVRSFARDTLNGGGTPLFLAYSLGKAQEVMHMLAPLSRSLAPIQIHGAGYKLCPVYEGASIDLGHYEPYNRQTCEGKILIAPVSAQSSGFASNVPNLKSAYCSGWALREASRTQLTVHKLIPLSDHLDFFELINLCQELRPQKVYITHTPNARVMEHYLEQLEIPSVFMDLEVEADD